MRETEGAKQVQTEMCPETRGSKEGSPETRWGTRVPARKERNAAAGQLGLRGAPGGGCVAPALRGAGGRPGTARSRGAGTSGHPPPPAVAAGLGRAGAAAGAGPAGCLPGLACQRGGGWQLDRRGRARRGRTGAAWQLASGSAEAQPDVRGLGSGNEEGTCRGRGAGAGRSGTVLGSGGGRRGVEIAQVGRAAPAETLLWEAHCFLLT